MDMKRSKGPLSRPSLVSPSAHKHGKPKTTRSWSRFLLSTLIGCVGCFMASYLFAPEQWDIRRLFSDPAVTKTTVGWSGKGIPTAEEYRLFAVEKKFPQTDPVQKLQATLLQMPQVFDLDSALLAGKSIDDVLAMLHQEIAFLVKVIKKSSDEHFDLTDTIFLAMDVMNQCLYRVMKKRVQLQSPP